MSEYKVTLPPARQLRREMTKEERHLWYDFLRNYTPRFARQKACCTYILDFYCASARLAVELDGSQHCEDTGKRMMNGALPICSRRGIQVLRSLNPDVMRNFEGGLYAD